MANGYKYYDVDSGCKGHIGNGRYRLFASEDDYKDYYNDNKEEIDNTAGMVESVSNVREKVTEYQESFIISEDEATYLLGGFITKNEADGKPSASLRIF